MSIFNLAIKMEDSSSNARISDTILYNELIASADRLEHISSGIGLEAAASPEECRLAIESVELAFIGVLVAMMAAAIAFILELFRIRKKRHGANEIARTIADAAKRRHAENNVRIPSDHRLEVLVGKYFSDPDLIEQLYESVNGVSRAIIADEYKDLREYRVIEKTATHGAVSDLKYLWGLYIKETKSFIHAAEDAGRKGDREIDSKSPEVLQSIYDELTGPKGYVTWAAEDAGGGEAEVSLNQFQDKIKAFDFSRDMEKINVSDDDRSVQFVFSEYSTHESFLKTTVEGIEYLKKDFERIQREKNETGGLGKDTFTLIGKIRSILIPYVRYVERAMTSALILHNASLRAEIALLRFREKALQDIKQSGAAIDQNVIKEHVEYCKTRISAAKNNIISGVL